MSKSKRTSKPARTFGPPDYPPRVVWHGMHYAPYERMVDRHVEGDAAWSQRVIDDVLKHREYIARRAASKSL